MTVGDSKKRELTLRPLLTLDSQLDIFTSQYSFAHLLSLYGTKLRSNSRFCPFRIEQPTISRWLLFPPSIPSTRTPCPLPPRFLTEKESLTTTWRDESFTDASLLFFIYQPEGVLPRQMGQTKPSTWRTSSSFPFPPPVKSSASHSQPPSSTHRDRLYHRLLFGHGQLALDVLDESLSRTFPSDPTHSSSFSPSAF